MARARRSRRCRSTAPAATRAATRPPELPGRLPGRQQAVGALRARLDSAAALGVPAHVTVLAPFVPPAALDPAVLTALATAVGSVAAFRATFERVAWFGDRVVWLAPEPAARFVALTKAVWAAFPGCPPYGGAFDDVVPHLTIGDGQPAGVLAEAERAVLPVLPVIASVRAVTLMQGSREPGSWQVLAEFPLGP